MDCKNDSISVSGRGHPAHPDPLHHLSLPTIILVTLAIKPRRFVLGNDGAHRAFLHACGCADTWRVGRYVLMPDHIHLFCTPCHDPVVALSKWVRYLKSCMTKRLCHDQKKPLTWKWQSDFWGTQMRNPDHFQEKWTYVVMNPVRKGLVSTAEQWPWRGEIHSFDW